MDAVAMAVWVAEPHCRDDSSDDDRGDDNHGDHMDGDHMCGYVPCMTYAVVMVDAAVADAVAVPPAPPLLPP